ncbi:DUF3524 domain-containing protein [bacterium]|nr:DUF3524 domain-containing protein [bacterium]
MRILFLEAYYGGSHRAFAKGWTERSRHDIQLLTLPARKWKWRMQTAAWLFAEQANRLDPPPDIVFATDMVNLAEFLALTRRRLGHTPAILYFHENQYSYPPQIEGKPDYRWGVINTSSALAADALVFNSEFHKQDFFENWRRGNRAMPDGEIEPRRLDRIERAARTIPVGIDFAFLDRHALKRPPVPDGPPRILWNHRWEHDKRPEAFFEALGKVKVKGRRFRLVVCGESFPERPPCFDLARERFRDEIEVFGHLPERRDYAKWLWRSDIVVSTSIQEFLGLSVIEALWCGCRPLLPNRLNYPFLLPRDQHEGHLYESDQDLVSRLEDLLREGEEIGYPPRQAFLRACDWDRVAGDLDDLVECLAARGTGM